MNKMNTTNTTNTINTKTPYDTTKGWIVTLAGTGINLALGVLYSWSIIKGGIPASWGWGDADKALPYAVACLCFAIAMIPAGKLQDKIGPRWVATLGGILTGLGCIIAGLSGSNLMGFVIGFGIMAGLGFGFGYASTTPPAVKWFPPQKTGVIAGIVVSGFGIASVYIAPLATKLLSTFAVMNPKDGVMEKGVSQTMILLGIGFLIVVTLLSQLLKNPPVAIKPSAKKNDAPAQPSASKFSHDMTWKEILKTAQFYVLWLMFFIGAGAGLTFISIAQDLGKKSLGELAFLAVVVLSVGNASGRIIAGWLSDKIGRQWTIFATMILQALALSTLFLVKNDGGWLSIMIAIILIGANYGSNLSLFPSAVKDFFGLKNFGFNYGLVFTAWGSAGLIMPWMNGFIKDVTQSNNLTYFIIIGLLFIGAGLTFVSRRLAEQH
ncbi:MAG: OFA family MFS transporter [Candidatus Omnitrophota bacterium]